MQRIVITKKTQIINGQETHYYVIPAWSLIDTNTQQERLIPHPQGNSVIEYQTLKDAVHSVKVAGFEYTLPAGEKFIEDDTTIIQEPVFQTGFTNLESILYKKLASKVDDINSNIAAAAISGLDELRNPKAIDLFINKIGEDNELVRKASINALVKYKNYVINKLVNVLDDTNWVKRNSAITCLIQIAEISNIDPQNIIMPILNLINDSNPIVQANALYAVGRIYRIHQDKQERV